MLRAWSARGGAQKAPQAHGAARYPRCRWRRPSLHSCSKRRPPLSPPSLGQHQQGLGTAPAPAAERGAGGWTGPDQMRENGFSDTAARGPLGCTQVLRSRQSLDRTLQRTKTPFQGELANWLWPGENRPKSDVGKQGRSRVCREWSGSGSTRSDKPAGSLAAGQPR